MATSGTKQTTFASLANKNILLGVSGSIAAYKACELLRLYQQAGATTRVVMTRQGQEFVTPLTMQSLSGHPVHTDLVDYQTEAAMGHIELARWSDCLVIAPASASLLARLASGDASDLLSAIFLATASPRIIAPAMNKEMWAKKSTQANLKILTEMENTIVVAPGSGWQACGEIGEGRLADLSDIQAASASIFATGSMAGKEVLITAGPTREPLDQARYLSNYSSGKMGYALATAASEAGAKVTLVSGPVTLTPPEKCKVIQVETAAEMLEACRKQAQSKSAPDIFIAAAAVADWRPASRHKGKLPKTELGDKMQLSGNPDILAEIGKLLPEPTLKVGFAAEAGSATLKKRAKEKLQGKGLDMVVANDIGTAFASEENEVLLLFAKGKEKQLPKQSKAAVARQIIKEAARLASEKPSKVTFKPHIPPNKTKSKRA